MAKEPTTIQTIRHMTEGGPTYVPGNQNAGTVYRPFAKSRVKGGRIGGLETLYDYFIDNVPDPDQALRADPDFLNRLYSHPYVAADMEKRCSSVSGLPDSIEPNPDAKDRKVAEFVAAYTNEVWKRIPNIASLYDEMQLAVLQGGVGHEWMWHREATGVEYPVKFYVQDKSRFLFDTEGNLAIKTREFPVWGVYIKAAEAVHYVDQFPFGKFQYHIHKRRPGTWEQPNLEGYMYYGYGEDNALYIPITFDNFVMRFRMKWLEKYGLPPTVLHYPMSNGINQEVLRIADSLRSESIITIPRAVGQDPDGQYKVSQLLPQTMSNGEFSSFTQQWTRPCVKDIILGGESGQYGSGGNSGGGYSAAIANQDSGPNVYYRRDARRISETLNCGIIPAIALQRFPNLPPTYWPKHRLEPKEERDRLQEMQIIQQASALIAIPEDQVYELAGVRKPKPGEKTVGGPQPAQQPGMPGAGQPKPPGGAPAPGMPKAPIGMGGGGGSIGGGHIPAGTM